MRKWIFILVLILPFSCREKKTEIYFTPQKAVWYFGQVRQLCDRDGGKLWGKNLYGPIMYIDRPTRKIIANSQDAEGILKLHEGVYTGTFPKEVVIDNTGVTFGGTLFATAPLPPEEDTFKITTRAIHGLFHVLRKKSGIIPSATYVRTMDEKSSRLLSKLEWRALRQAINSDSVSRKQALRDALVFRHARRELFPEEIKSENGFDCWEGLTTFTFLEIASSGDAEFRQRMTTLLDRFYNFQTFSRSAGFITGAVYGYLVYAHGYDMKNITEDTTDLGSLAQRTYGITLPAICRDVSGSLAMAYDVESIYSEEEKRLSVIRENLHKQIATFTEKPVVFLELESPLFDFEPEEISSLDTLGTIYKSIRVMDNWGKLTVEKGGCLVSYNLKTVRVSAKNFSEDKNRLSGDGWHLILNDDWKVVKLKDNYLIRKLMP
ncbi:MAG: hypothetical protein U0T33_04215 [Bacteroidales bacterium]